MGIYGYDWIWGAGSYRDPRWWRQDEAMFRRQLQGGYLASGAPLEEYELPPGRRPERRRARRGGAPAYDQGYRAGPAGEFAVPYHTPRREVKGRGGPRRWGGDWPGEPEGPWPRGEANRRADAWIGNTPFGHEPDWRYRAGPDRPRAAPGPDYDRDYDRDFGPDYGREYRARRGPHDWRPHT